MRILHVVAMLSPDGAYGGPARVALNQCAELRRSGHDVLLAAGDGGYGRGPRLLQDVPVHLFAARKVVPRTGFAGLASPGLLRWFKRHRRDFDVVHVHFGRDLTVFPVAIAAHRSGVPYVLQPHGMVVPSDHPLAGPIDGRWTRALLRDAAAVCYLSDEERGQIAEVAGTALRFVELPNGVPAYPAAVRAAGPPEVIFVGRMHPVKRPLAFVAMAHELLDDGIDARFTLVGPDEGEGSALRTAMADRDRIVWEGAVAPDEVPARVARASVFVLPSTRDAYPMSVLEAMSVGLPVVTTAACGLAPLITRTRSGIVAGNTSSALAGAVAGVLSDDRAAARMAERGKAAVHTELGMQAIAERLVEVYQGARKRAR